MNVSAAAIMIHMTGKWPSHPAPPAAAANMSGNRNGLAKSQPACKSCQRPIQSRRFLNQPILQPLGGSITESLILVESGDNQRKSWVFYTSRSFKIAARKHFRRLRHNTDRDWLWTQCAANQAPLLSGLVGGNNRALDHSRASL